jgi:hypothetical protein
VFEVNFFCFLSGLNVGNCFCILPSSNANHSMALFWISDGFEDAHLPGALLVLLQKHHHTIFQNSPETEAAAIEKVVGPVPSPVAASVPRPALQQRKKKQQQQRNIEEQFDDPNTESEEGEHTSLLTSLKL